MPRYDVVALVLGCVATSSVARAQECVSERPTDPGAPYAFGVEAAAFDSEAGRFRVWYTEVGEHAVADPDGDVPDSVRRAAAILDETSQYFQSVLDFERARTDANYSACSSNGGDGRFDVYLVNFEAADGSIGLDQCSDDVPTTCAGFMLVDHRFEAYPDFDTGARTVLPHEYFHLIQAAYASPFATWWSEGTAQWATKQLYPDLLDMERYFGVYLQNVDRPLDLPPATAAQPFSYATALFAVFLGERFGRDVALAPFPTERDGAVSGNTSGLSANYYSVSSDIDAEFEVELDSARTQIAFVPFVDGVAELDAAVELPGRVRGPGALVIAGTSTDYRDATYWVGRVSNGLTDVDAGGYGAQERPSSEDSGSTDGLG